MKPPTYLNLGGSIGSFCISTIRITLCLAPELKATPCWDGVYLRNVDETTGVTSWSFQQVFYFYYNPKLDYIVSFSHKAVIENCSNI